MKTLLQALLTAFGYRPLTLAGVVSALWVTAVPSGAQTITQIIDSGGPGGQVGQDNSQAIVAGNPAIAYYDRTERYLKYVRALDAGGTVWGTPVVVAFSPFDGNGLYASMTVVDGKPAIAFHDSVNYDLKYVRASDALGTAWDAPLTVDSEGYQGGYLSLAVVNGHAAISYVGTGAVLRYVQATDAAGTAWGAPLTLDDTAQVGYYTSLAVVNGNPAISYADHTHNDLRYIRATDANGTTWSSPVTVASTGRVGDHTSMVVVSGNPAISYLDDTNDNLKFVRAMDPDGLAWAAPVSADTRFANGRVGRNTTMAIVNGNPAIGYFNETAYLLEYVRANDATGTTWGTPVILANAGYVDNTAYKFASLAVADGLATISFYDVTNGALKYVRASDAGGTAWGTAATVENGAKSGNTGYAASQVIVDGYPAVCYVDETGGSLKYLRATNATGTSWGTPVIVDLIGGVGSFVTTMGVINGRPAIGYYDNITHAMQYIRADDAHGTSWGTPVQLDTYTGTTMSLAVIGGRPAITYKIGFYDGSLRYTRANDADGLSWSPPVIVDDSGNVGRDSSLAEINGRPAISYYDIANGDLRYVRATDPDGTAWGSPLILDGSGGDVGFCSSLAVIDGYPAVSYYDVANPGLKYVRATDANGTTWGTPLTLDSGTYTGYCTNLRVVHGHAAIGYVCEAVKYLEANDAGGTSWGTPLVFEYGFNSALAVTEGGIGIGFLDPVHKDLKYVSVVFAPEIALEQHAGVDLPSGTGGVDYGGVGVASSSAQKVFTIKNTGMAALAITSVEMAGGDVNDFAVDAPGFPTSVPAGGSATFGVTFVPIAAGARMGTLRILSDDDDEAIFEITFTGIGLTAQEAWRQQYFGTWANAGDSADDADPDGDSRTNLFEFVAGLVPNDPVSRFALRVEPVVGQPGQVAVVFGPLAAGRTYVVKYKTDLSEATWTTAADISTMDNGAERTVTDLGASAGSRFYQVEITRQ